MVFFRLFTNPGDARMCRRRRRNETKQDALDNAGVMSHFFAKRISEDKKCAG
jgi:hypothetical protein